jgi:predicted Zn-dependent peptidase
MRAKLCAIAIGLSVVFAGGVRPAAGTVDVPVEKTTLANGLTVLVHEDRDLPVVSLYIFFHTGSRNERPGITGISHLFEHMMFNGGENTEGSSTRSSRATAARPTATRPRFHGLPRELPAARARARALDRGRRMRALAITPKNLEQERGS